MQEGNHSYWKKFHGKSDKKQKIFFCTPATKLQKISTLNNCNKAKQIYPKKLLTKVLYEFQKQSSKGLV